MLLFKKKEKKRTISYMRMENKVWIWIQVSDTCALGLGVPGLGVGSALSQAAFWETGLLTLFSTPLPHTPHSPHASTRRLGITVYETDFL